MVQILLRRYNKTYLRISCKYMSKVLCCIFWCGSGVTKYCGITFISYNTANVAYFMSRSYLLKWSKTWIMKLTTEICIQKITPFHKTTAKYLNVNTLASRFKILTSFSLSTKYLFFPPLDFLLLSIAALVVSVPLKSLLLFLA